MSSLRSFCHALFAAHRRAGEQRAQQSHRRYFLTIVAAFTGVILLGGLVGAQTAGARTAAHSRTSSEYRMAAALQRQLNAERRVHHLRPLTVSRRLMSSARTHNFTMARFDAMSHRLPREPLFTSRIRKTGYRWVWAGENIGFNSRATTAGVLQLQTMMYKEKAPFDDHRRNILNSHYREIGIDVFVDRVNQRVWLTTDFGSRTR